MKCYFVQEKFVRLEILTGISVVWMYLLRSAVESNGCNELGLLLITELLIAHFSLLPPICKMLYKQIRNERGYFSVALQLF